MSFRNRHRGHQPVMLRDADLPPQLMTVADLFIAYVCHHPVLYDKEHKIIKAARQRVSNLDCSLHRLTAKCVDFQMRS